MATYIPIKLNLVLIGPIIVTIIRTNKKKYFKINIGTKKIPHTGDTESLDVCG